MKVCLDPGHSGPYEPGASFMDYTEAMLNMIIARKVGKILDEIGHEVIFTREGDINNDSLVYRAAIANNSNADAFISIHCNAAASPFTRGVETYCFHDSESGRMLAAHIQTELALLNYSDDRGIKSANLAVLRLACMPAALVECGFITSEHDRNILSNASWQEKIAEAIATGIQLFFG